jgi:hypothetical protein
MHTVDWINIVAILLAPLVALRVSAYLQDRKERRQRKLSIFRTLMATRATPLRLEHVQALNMIDVEFYSDKDKKDKEVRDAWKAYLDQLSRPNLEIDWTTRREDRCVDLMHAVGTAVGYEFDKTHIRRTSYFPIAHGELEADQTRIRKAVIALLEGKEALPITVKDSDAGPGSLSGSQNQK